MPRKLTITGVLMALVIGALGVFQSSASAAIPVQTFLKADVDYDTCFGGAAPGAAPGAAAGTLACNTVSGSSDTNVLANQTGPSYNIIRLPKGSRLTLPVTFTPFGPGQWQTDITASSCSAAGTNVTTKGCNDGIPSSDPPPVGVEPYHRNGTVTGNVTAYTDLLCNSSLGGPDVLATNASTPGTAGNDKWPSSGRLPGDVDPNWVPYNFKRTFAGDLAAHAPAAAQTVLTGVAIGAGIPAAGQPDAYIDQIKPQPATFPFVSIDGGTLTALWLFGTVLLPLPNATSLQNATYESAYKPGLTSSVALLGGDPANPPSPDYVCLDSPQSSVSTSLTLKAPAAPGMYPRWTLFQSAADFRSGDVSRILDEQCITVGPAILDTDGDCLPDSLEAANNSSPTNPDSDGDGVPDGVEVASGTAAGLPCGAVAPLPLGLGLPPSGIVAPPAQGTTSADCDGDGASDFDEMFQFTNPSNPDTDGDGSLDKQDNGADEDAPLTPTNVLDSKYDDNCPADANPLQENSDSTNDYRLLPTAGNLDTTNPHQDILGDACDSDNDNDGLPNVTENGLTILASGVFPQVIYCKGPGVGAAPSIVMSTTNPDVDNDLGLDGRECQQGTRPDDASAAQRLANASASKNETDADGDQLFNAPGAAGLSTAESFYRTQNINLVVGQEDNPDGDAFLTGNTDADSDNDGLKDGIEVRYYGTDPTNADTDGDGCSDGKEAGDVDGNRSVTAGDLGIMANAAVFGNYRNPGGDVNPLKKTYDFDRNGSITAGDLAQVSSALIFGSCGAPSNQQGRTISGQTKLPSEP